MPILFNATLERKDKLNENTYQIWFKLPQGFSFKAGQYIWLVLPNLLFPDPKGERRAFSITSSCNNNNYISILFRNSGSGYKRTLINMSVGDLVQIIGAFGSTFMSENLLERKIVMIAGGVGVAPFLGIIRSLPQNQNMPKLTLINFNTSPEAQFLNSELSDLCQRNNVYFLNKIGRANLDGVINIQDFNDALYFICGPQNMVNAIYFQLLKDGIADDQMIFEEIYPNEQAAVIL